MMIQGVTTVWIDVTTVYLSLAFTTISKNLMNLLKPIVDHKLSCLY